MKNKLLYQLLRLVVFVGIIIVVSANSSVETIKRPHAILFVHGLAGSEHIWYELIEDLDKKQFIYIANYRIVERSVFEIKKESKHVITESLNNKVNPVYTIRYEDNQNLTFQEQGKRLRKVVDEIHKNTGRDIFLFAHWMGGLASRACIMQNKNNIAGLVTAGTPHAGSMLAYTPMMREKGNMAEFVLSYIMEGYASKSMELEISAKAIALLAPDNQAMIKMNQQVFPTDIPLVNIISNWKPGTISLGKVKQITLTQLQDDLSKYKTDNYVPLDFFSKGIQLGFNDGVVSVPSQAIKMGVVNGNDLDPMAFFTDRFHTEIPEDTKTMKDALNYILAQSQNGVNNDQITIAFLIDSSGSMEESDPNNIRHTALQGIIDLLKGNEDFIVVDFDGKATWLNEKNYRNFDKDLLKRNIELIDSDGGTSIDIALLGMKDVLLKVNAGKKTGVMLLSDGKSKYNNETQWYSDNGIPIFTISYKDFGDPALLNRIANESHGLYIQADNESDVVAAFQQFYNLLSGQNKYYTCSGEVNNGKSIEHDFYVDPQSEQMYCSVVWLDEPVEIEIKSPSGKTINPIKNPSYFLRGSNHSIFKIEKPEKGIWTTKILKPSGVKDISKYIIEAGGKSPISYLLDKVGDTEGIMQYQLVDNKGQILSDVKPEIIITTPKGHVFNNPNVFKDGKIRFLPSEGQGNYQLDLSFQKTVNSGDIIQRNFKVSVFFNEGILPYISNVKFTSGSILKTNIGTVKGCYVGMNCKVYTPDRLTVKAEGCVAMVTKEECTIELNKMNSAAPINLNDIVEIDQEQWLNNVKK